MSDLHEVFADVEEEGMNINETFEDMEKETPSESQPEETEEVSEPEVGEEDESSDNAPTEEPVPQPLHENPRWIKQQEKIRELEAQNAEINKYLQQVEQMAQEEQSSERPEWFEELALGDSDKAWSKYRQYENERLTRLKEEIIYEQQEAARQAQERRSSVENWVQDEIDRLKETNEFDEQEFRNVMAKYRPTSDDGNLDFDAGMEIYQTMKSVNLPSKVKSQVRKRVADTASQSSGQGAKRKEYVTANDIRHKGWTQIIS